MKINSNEHIPRVLSLLLASNIDCFWDSENMACSKLIWSFMVAFCFFWQSSRYLLSNSLQSLSSRFVNGLKIIIKFARTLRLLLSNELQVTDKTFKDYMKSIEKNSIKNHQTSIFENKLRGWVTKLLRNHSNSWIVIKKCEGFSRSGGFSYKIKIL